MRYWYSYLLWRRRTIGGAEAISPKRFKAASPCAKDGTYERYISTRGCCACAARYRDSVRDKRRVVDKNRTRVLTQPAVIPHHPAIIPAPVEGSTIRPPSLKQLMAGR